MQRVEETPAEVVELRPRTNNDLCTPLWLVDLVMQVDPIRLDPCSNPWSIVPADVRLDGSPGRDGMTADWSALATGGLAYVNPPYGRGHMRRWVTKIAIEAAKGCQIVALVKSDHSTRWWDVLMGAADARCELAERVRFVGGRHGSGTFPSTVFYAGHNPHRFASVFEAVGHVEILTRRLRGGAR